MTNTSRTLHTEERGAFLLAVVVMVVVLGGLSLAFLQENVAERTSVVHHESSFLALELAEAGLIQAELEIRALADRDGDGVGTVSAAYGGGLFEVEATRDPTFADRWTLRARGESGHSVRVIEVGVRRREAGYFIEGLFSKDDLVLNGSIATDSYDSRVGDWSSQATAFDKGGVHAATRGHIGSNAGIRIVGSKAHIRGNAIPGPLYTVQTSGSPVVLGDRLPRLVEIPLPAPPLDEFDAAYRANDNDQLTPGTSASSDASTTTDKKVPPGQAKKDDDDTGKTTGNSGYDAKTMSLSPKGQTRVTLDGGTYFFTDIDLSGGAEIVVKGPSRIYVTGNLDLSGGGIVNETGVATNCLLFAHPYALPPGHDPSGAEVKLTGNSGAALAIYAPERLATLRGTSDLFGSVVAREIRVVGDANFHYDEALRDVQGGSAVVMERLYWRDVSEPAR